MGKLWILVNLVLFCGVLGSLGTNFSDNDLELRLQNVEQTMALQSKIIEEQKMRISSLETRCDQTDERERRLLADQSIETPCTCLSKVVAFYSYLSHPEIDPGNHHTLIFDVVKTNTDNVYNKFTGAFTAPVSGIYGFTYTIRMGAHTSIIFGPFELVRNDVAEGVIFFSMSGGQESETGNVIIHVDAGDKVFIRTHSTHPMDSNIYSDTNGWTSFAGWLIHPDQ